ncbi:MAG: hypothetical protein B7Z60_10190 [Ferrovum sp. 37-45-19]|nr:MAG: hypothetical protein B7Z60_10190 [Ferrovum sp. 37-45-19]
MFASASMDFVFSSHVLEHIENTEKTLKEWWRLIKPGGYLVLYLPHKDFYPNMGSPDANPSHLHDFLPSDIESIMESVGNWDLVRNEDRNEDNEYSFFQVYKKVFVSNDSKKHRHFRSYQNPKPEKTCAVVRYGAFGDHIQTASLFPQLKEQGYHITMYSSNPGFEAIKHDPHIDAVILQDRTKSFWNIGTTKPRSMTSG